MKTISHLSTNELKNTKQNKNINKLSKQLEQEQNQRNGDHMEGYQQGSWRDREWEGQREGKGTGNK